jgi:hypothetical protein
MGTTVDRVPSNATDTFFRPASIQQILEAGWGVISYRQNTELFVQAWHWNPGAPGAIPQERAISQSMQPRERRFATPTDTIYATAALREAEARNSAAIRA